MAPTPGHGRLRASHTDREHLVDVLKAAFVQGQLTRDELETRGGRALAARTYAGLPALTPGLPALTSGPPPAAPFRTRPGPRRRPENGLLAVGPAG